MTIQISVTVWTILCFLALYLILRSLLFKPLLELMDKRKQKIAAAKAAREASGRQLEERRQQALAKAEADAAQARQNAEAEAETIRLEGKRLLEQARADRLTTVEAYRKQMEAEYSRDVKAAEEPLMDIADQFLASLYASKP